MSFFGVALNLLENSIGWVELSKNDSFQLEKIQETF